MDLENFVAQTLAQITKGIQKAQREVGDTGAWINPAGYGLPKAEQRVELSTGVFAYIHDVEFDVAVTVSDEQKAGAGAGISVFGAKVKAGGDVAYENEEVSRVSFSVPVVWPQSVRDEREQEHDRLIKQEADEAAAESRRANDSFYKPPY